MLDASVAECFSTPLPKLLMHPAEIGHGFARPCLGECRVFRWVGFRVEPPGAKPPHPPCTSYALPRPYMSVADGSRQYSDVQNSLDASVAEPEAALPEQNRAGTETRPYGVTQ